MSPYWNVSGLEFFILFFQRLALLFSGNLSLKEIASDELQIFVIGSVGISCAILGALLVLKKMTMLANSLSHTILIGIILCYVFLHYQFQQSFTMSQLLFASIITALITTFATALLQKNFKLQEDASIGLVFTSLFSLGILCITFLAKNTHLGTEIVMGNVDALHFDDLPNALYLLVVNLICLIVFFPQWKAICFDEDFAKSIGIRVSFFSYLLMVLTAATSMGAFRAVGVLLVLAFIVVPGLMAKMWAKTMKKMVILATVFSLVATLVGVFISRHILTEYSLALSTAGIITTLLGFSYLISSLTRSYSAAKLFGRCVKESPSLDLQGQSEHKH